MKLFYPLATALTLGLLQGANAAESARVFAGTGSDGRECKLTLNIADNSLQYIGLEGNAKGWQWDGFHKNYFEQSLEGDQIFPEDAGGYEDHVTQSVTPKSAEVKVWHFDDNYKPVFLLGRYKDAWSFHISGDLNSNALKSAEYVISENVGWLKIDQSKITCQHLMLQ